MLQLCGSFGGCHGGLITWSLFLRKSPSSNWQRLKRKCLTAVSVFLIYLDSINGEIVLGNIREPAGGTSNPRDLYKIHNILATSSQPHRTLNCGVTSVTQREHHVGSWVTQRASWVKPGFTLGEPRWTWREHTGVSTQGILWCLPNGSGGCHLPCRPGP